VSVVVLLEAPVRADEVAKMKSYLAEVLPGTRTYEGCAGIDLYFDTADDTSLILIEHWASRQHHEQYLGWRTETGVMEKIGSMLAGPPSIRYLDRADA